LKRSRTNQNKKNLQDGRDELAELGEICGDAHVVDLVHVDDQVLLCIVSEELLVRVVVELLMSSGARAAKWRKRENMRQTNGRNGCRK
jgi:hypothetical protein